MQKTYAPKNPLHIKLDDNKKNNKIDTKEVTDIVSCYLKNNILNFKENYNSKFTDIHYGKPKKLVINYSDLEERNKNVIFKEDEPIHIENISKIINCTYKV